MSSILYYSTLCKNCDKILNELSRTDLQNGIHFVCIDKRVERGGAHFVVLETGEEVLLPKEVTRVPALLLLESGNRVLFGNEIYSVFGEALEQENRTATGGNIEPRQPEAMSTAGFHTSVHSSHYSPLDGAAEHDDGSAYASATYDNIPSIETPPEDYVPDKMNEDSIKNYQDARNKVVPPGRGLGGPIPQ